MTATATARAEPAGMWRYGARWPTLDVAYRLDPRWVSANVPPQVQQAWMEFFIERKMCQWASDPEALKKLEAKGADHLGFKEHFKRMVSVVLDQPWVEEKFRWQWNPYTETFLDDTMANQFYAIAGHGSSGKSKWQAVWGLFKFVLSPSDTTVFFTSTTKDEARKRIWGDVAQGYWKWFCTFFLDLKPMMIGHLVESVEKIQAIVNGKKSDLCGLFLIPGEKGHEDVAKLVGFKNKNVILCADEYQFLSDTLDSSAQSNLILNKNFQMIVTGNLGDWYTPLGRFCTPVGGVGAISANGKGMIEDPKTGMRGWKTPKGFVRWLDGERSPNVLAGTEQWRGILTREKLEAQRKAMADGYLSAWDWWCQYRSFPSPEGKVNSVFTPAEISSSCADQREFGWIESPVIIIFLDAAFTADGDAAACAIGFCGLAADMQGKVQRVLSVDEIRVLNANLDTSIDPVTGKEKDPIPQIAARFVEIIRSKGISPQHAGLDASGAPAFASLVATFPGIGQKVCRVNFQGEVSDRLVSLADDRPSKEAYDRLVTELWFSAKAYVMTGQLKGIPAQAAKEFCTRTSTPWGRGGVCIQKKKDMKTSPNFADSIVGLLEVARRNFDFSPNLIIGEMAKPQPDSFLEWAKDMSKLHRPGLIYH